MYKHCMGSFIPREKTIKRKETDMETSFQIMIYILVEFCQMFTYLHVLRVSYSVQRDMLSFAHLS